MRHSLYLLTLLALGVNAAYAAEPTDQDNADRTDLKARAEAALAELDAAENELAEAKADLASLEKDEQPQPLAEEEKPELIFEQAPVAERAPGRGQGASHQTLSVRGRCWWGQCAGLRSSSSRV